MISLKSDQCEDSENSGIGKLRPRIELIDRRRFLQLTGIAGVSLILGFNLQPSHATKTDSGHFTPNAFLRISRAGIVILATQPEMGEGITTSLPIRHEGFVL